AAANSNRRHLQLSIVAGCSRAFNTPRALRDSYISGDNRRHGRDARTGEPMTLSLLVKDDRRPSRPTITLPRPDRDDPFGHIRCRLCHWRPSRASRWSCGGGDADTPESPFEGCGTSWNTFKTRGRCPGCGHRWQWTSCPSCQQWSLHEDWYDDQND